MAGIFKTRRAFLAGLGSLAAGSAAAPLVRAGRSQQQAGIDHNPRVAGSVLRRGQPDYEHMRRDMVWQAWKPERFPDLIVNAHDEDDVVQTVHYAREQGLSLSVRGSGHNYIASYLREGGVLLNVAHLREVAIEADKQLARVQPGVSSVELSSALAGHGLAFPVAHGPSVALGGYLLGGGMGWNGEYWNRFACFNVRAIELVTAAGEKLRVSGDEHADLFWAARGAGPAFFGVVTRYHLDVFPLPAAITSCTYIYTVDQLDNLIEWVEQARGRQDIKIELSFILESSDEVRQCVISAVCFANRDDEARRLLNTLLQHLPEQGRLIAREYQPMTFAEVLAMTRTSVPLRMSTETAWVENTAAAVNIMAEHFHRAPSGDTVIIANYRSNTDLPEDTAYAVTGPLFLNWSTRWESASRDDEHMRWMDDLAGAIEPLTTGCYVNETDYIRRPHWINKCFPETTRKRLTAIRARYDPDELFPPPFELNG